MTIIEIHEFSTGINVKGTPESWYSTGFSGNYMNSTLEEIPKAVHQAIALDLFKLSENAIQALPAIIGREVKLYNENWSVLAVVSHARDESGRPIEVNRYFFTQELGNISHLLTHQITCKLFFNPFDVKELHKPYQYDTSMTKTDKILDMIFENDIVILDMPSKNSLILSRTLTKTGQKIPAKAINELAEKRASEDNHLISWAFNVEGLRKPHTFLVIYPASDLADKYILHSLDIRKQGDPYRVEEELTIQILTNWINNFDIQLNEIQTIVNFILNPYEYNDSFWERVFFDLGINDTQKSTYYSRLVRLYLLYSLIIPKKFPEFIKWLYRKKDEKNQSYYKDAEKFGKLIQTYISDSDINGLKSKTNECLSHLICEKLNNNEDFKDVNFWFNQNKEGLLSEQCLNEYIGNLDRYLMEAKDNQIQDDELFSKYLEKEFAGQCKLNKLKKNDYKLLAKFLEKIETHEDKYRVRALFYHLSQGKIPTSIWEKCDFTCSSPTADLTTKDKANNFVAGVTKLINQRTSAYSITTYQITKRLKDKERLYGITVSRKLKVIEQIQRLFNKLILNLLKLLLYPKNVPMAGSIFIILLLVGGLSGYYIRENNILPKNFNFTNKNNEVNPEKLTILALKSVVDDFKNRSNVQVEKTAVNIIKILDPNNKYKLNFQYLLWPEQNTRNWSSAIKEYQQKVQAQAQAQDMQIKDLGSIKIGDNTDIYLRCQLDLKLAKNTQPEEQCNIVSKESAQPRSSPSPSTSSSPSPSPSATLGEGSEDKNWESTVNSLDKLRDEFVNVHHIPSEEVESAIEKVLTKGKGAYRFMQEKDISTKTPNSGVWIQSIIDFQNSIKFGYPNGMIHENDFTYKLLKCQVAKELTIQLRNPPSECSS